jgi:DNA polymerase III epsilon subunit-like protein
LCTAQLASVLDPGLSDLNLEAIAAAYGLEVAGRHTALGDALATAELYLHLLALMQAKGDRTLADAQARAATARRVIRQQEAAGW